MMSGLFWPYLWLRQKSTDFIEDSKIKIQACLFLCILLLIRLEIEIPFAGLCRGELWVGPRHGSSEKPCQFPPSPSVFSHTAPPPCFWFCTKWVTASKSPEEMKRIRGLHPDCTFPCDLFAQGWSRDASESAWWSAHLKEIFYVYVFTSVCGHVCTHTCGDQRTNLDVPQEPFTLFLKMVSFIS